MNKKYILLFIVVIALALGSYFTEKSFLAQTIIVPVASSSLPIAAPESPSPQKPVSPPSRTTTSAPIPNVTLQIGNTSYRAFVPGGATVLDLMRSLASSSNFTFAGREYPSLGFFVESINGKKGTNGYYWFLYVNGKSSDTGASETHLKTGDVIEWKYEKSN